MLRVSSLLGSLLLAFSLNAIPAESTSPSREWVPIGLGPQARYDVLKSSIEPDATTLSVEFMMRTTFKTPMKNEKSGLLIGTVAERTVVLCREDVMITVAQLQYNEKGEHVASIAKSIVWEDPGFRGSVVTETIRWACGKNEPPSKEDPVKHRRETKPSAGDIA